MENNYRYSVTLAAWCLEHGARFINASSAATYGDGSRGFSDDEARLGELRPLNMYGYSKQLFDLWAQREGVLGSLASLKFFNVFGPNEYHKGDMMSVICKAQHADRPDREAQALQELPPRLPRRRPDARFRLREGLRGR
jgi:ADP-L-glycero-D-manno-heptose 6-epimerase